MRPGFLLCVSCVVLLVATAGAATAGSNDGSDLAVTATAPADSFVTGSSLTYTIAAADKGPATSQNVVVSTSLTGKAEITSATPQAGTCVISETKKHVTCKLAMIEPGTTDQIALVVTADASGQLIVNTSGRQRNPDTDTSNQTASIQTRMYEIEPPTAVAFTGSTFTHAVMTRPPFSVSWTATDTGSRVATFDVRYRASAYNGSSFGPYRLWQQATTGRHAVFAGRPGVSYCFSLRAADRDGNVSAWTPDRCVSVLLGSRQLKQSGAWKLHKSPSGTVSVSSHAQGAQLSLGDVVAKQVVIEASAAPGYGKLAVLWNGRLLRTFTLTAPTYRHLLLPLAPFAAISRGTLMLRVAAGHTVTVLGVAVRKAVGR